MLACVDSFREEVEEGPREVGAEIECLPQKPSPASGDLGEVAVAPVATLYAVAEADW